MNRMLCAWTLVGAISLVTPGWADKPETLGAAAVKPSKPSPTPSSYTISSGNTRVQISSTYTFSVYDVGTGATLLTQKGASFTIGGKVYTSSTLSNVTTTGASLNGTLAIVNGRTKGTATVNLTLEGDVLRVNYLNVTVGGAVPTKITESFVDQGENIYGVWEHAYGASIDNRGLTRPFTGTEVIGSTNADVGGVFAATARAPFFMTSKNIGVYTPTEAAGTYTLAVNSTTSQSFNVSALQYVVFHGTSPQGVLSLYNQEAGPSCLPPLWAFDSIWWRDSAYSIPTGSAARNAQELVMEDGAKLQAYQIPAGAIWIDRPYGSNTVNRDNNVANWGNMDFDPAAFPAPKDMIKDLRTRGLRTMVWVANKANNDLYTDASALGYLFTGYSASPALDLRKAGASSFMQGELTRLVHAAQESQIDPDLYISGFKIDRGGEGEMPEALINTETTLMHQAATAALASGVGEGDYFAFTRNINDKGRQYAAVWSGDPDTTWTAFQTSVMNGIRCGLINFPMWGSDVGGYHGAAPTKELYARWFGFGTYSPMMEVMQMPGRTVWFDYNGELIPIATAAAKTHHDLIPYTYSLAAQNRMNGVPIMRAMVLEFPDDIAARKLGTQYMYGPGLLVAPVVTSGVTSRSVYLPAGRWLDYNGRVTKYTGAASVTAAAPLGVVPVFVREGAIIPRGDVVQTNNNWSTDWTATLRIECFPGVAGGSAASSTFRYFDGRAGSPAGEGSPITMNTDAAGIHIAATLPIGGDYDIYCTEPTSVKVNGTVVTNYTYDAGTKLLRVPFGMGGTTIDVLGSGSIWP